MTSSYRRRIAPSPTGYLHLGHARTGCHGARKACGWGAYYREEDLDFQRCRSVSAMPPARLAWFGIQWEEGGDQIGDFAPCKQSERMSLYLKAWQRLKAMELIYPRKKSRKTIRKPLPINKMRTSNPLSRKLATAPDVKGIDQPDGYNWRFRVPLRKISLNDACLGPCQFISGQDFGDFNLE